MTIKSRSFRPSPALVLAVVALFVALGGSALAVGVGKNTVASPQIKDGTVRTVDLAPNSVKLGKVAPNAVDAEAIAENAVSSPEVAQDSLNAGDLAADSVGASEIAPAAVTAGELGTVTQRQSAPQPIANGANGSVTVTCAPGEQLLSGGGQPANFGVEMTSSRPTGNSWLYQARNNSGAASSITAYALCLAA